MLLDKQKCRIAWAFFFPGLGFPEVFSQRGRQPRCQEVFYRMAYFPVSLLFPGCALTVVTALLFPVAAWVCPHLDVSCWCFLVETYWPFRRFVLNQKQETGPSLTEIFMGLKPSLKDFARPSSSLRTVSSPPTWPLGCGFCPRSAPSWAPALQTASKGHGNGKWGIQDPQQRCFYGVFNIFLLQNRMGESVLCENRFRLHSGQLYF